MRSIAVYCGSSAGNNPAFAQAAGELGKTLAERNCTLIYGGSHAGLMGILADAALAAGGHVIGVIPQALVGRELAHAFLTELEIVPSMHARKARMCELADGFIALPGGLGTLEEIVEMMTWDQLGIHSKPCALLNIAGFYSGLVAFLQSVVTQGLLKREQFERLIVADAVGFLIETLQQRIRCSGAF